MYSYYRQNPSKNIPWEVQNVESTTKNVQQCELLSKINDKTNKIQQSYTQDSRRRKGAVLKENPANFFKYANSPLW